MTELASENKLVNLLRRGDRKAVNQFVDDYGQFMYHVCYKILLHVSEAEEAAQDAVMKVIKAIDTYDDKASLKAWCYTIAYRTAIDYKRKIKVHTDLSSIPEIKYDHSADENIRKSETNQGIASLLKHLDEEARALVSLFYLEEKNIKEVILITGLTESNVKIKLFRARKDMAKYAERYFERV